MINTAIQNGDEPITLASLQALFQVNDFSAMTSNYKPSKATSEENSTYLRAKALFHSAWNAEMKRLTKKGSMMDLARDSPIHCLEESEENLVAGSVMELLQIEDRCITLVDQVLESMNEPILSEIKQYAMARGKTMEELTDNEFQQGFDAFADEFLSRMMKLLLQVQDVPALLNFMGDMPAQEDFEQNAFKSFRKIDFERQWTHSRTKIGTMLELTPEIMREIPGGLSSTAKDALELGLPPADTEQELSQLILHAFIDSLDNDIDRQIIYMRADGKTQAEIATALGYTNHSPVTKRLQRLKPKFESFMEHMNGY